jgi:hypothetical protein
MRPGVEIDRRGTAAWELVGVLFILVVGSSFHFVFEWTGESLLVAPFVPVNESVWEHLKMAFWPTLLWAFVERAPLRGRVNNFMLAKSVGILLMPFVIAAIFYAYTAVLGHHLLALDAGSFVAAILLGQFVSYRLLTGDQRSPVDNRVIPLFVILTAVAFVVFTFIPPHIGLFMDGPSGQFGIMS